MTSHYGDNLDSEEHDLVQLAWQDLARLKVNSQNCWKFVNYRTVERVPSGRKETVEMKLDACQDNVVYNDCKSRKDHAKFNGNGAVVFSDSDEESSKSTTSSISTCTSRHKMTKSAVKTRENKGLRVQFHENVHVQLISPGTGTRPTIQRLKSSPVHKPRALDQLPRLQGNRSQSAKLARSKQSGLSAHAQAVSNVSVHVDGKSMPRASGSCMEVFQRFLPQGALSECIDMDSAAIDIVRNYNDPFRGVYGDSTISDLYTY